MDRITVVTIVVVLGTMMAAIDSTIVILALPTIVQSLHSDLSTLTWVILIYMLVAAILTTQLGRVGDNYGRSKIYNLGFLIFTIGSALCGAAPNASLLVGFRGVQAIGASMMQANSGAVIADYYPPNQRGKAYGYTSLGWNIGALLGIVLGGVITTFLGWRYIFYINVPIGIAATIIGFREIKDVNVFKARFDVLGMVVLAVILSLITYSAVDITRMGVTTLNSSLLILGVLLLIPFYFIERRTQSPIIDFSAFKNRVLSASLLASFMQSTGYLSTAFMLTMYLQGIRGLSPFNASLLLVPGYVVASMLGPITGRISDRIGARIPATLGIALMMINAFIYAEFLTLTTPYLYIILASVIGGIGSALFYPANNSAVMANAPRKLYGGISGILRTLANTGILLSYAIAISIASLSVPRYVAFQVFLGTSQLIGGIGQKFLIGIHSAFFTSLTILAIALILSAIRGKEERESIGKQELTEQKLTK